MDMSVVADTNRTIEPKMQFSGKVIKTRLAGAVIDIGVGKPAVLHISQVVAPEGVQIKRIEDVLKEGEMIDVWVKKVARKDDEERIELTMMRPLDLEWREIKIGTTVKGNVVRLEKFGAFVEIGAERPGLVHISEMAHGYVKVPGDVVKEGDEIEAQVIEVNRRKKQIKLSMKALQQAPEIVEEKPKPTAKQNPARFAADP
ncbi:MAG: S1 RNA-binding domain-containing protein, partial [Anaerolineaceae bacterium]|nr:S1 RNA-binding domain-containing protein [Anaerolineaceae bacterium]